MKNFPAAFAAEKNKAIGARPVWIMRLTINAVDYWLAIRSLAIPSFTGSTPWPAGTSITTLALVKSWGSIQQGMTQWLSEFQVSEFSVSLVFDPGQADLATLVTTYPVESSPVELYEWFVGCAAPPQRIFHGYVRDVDSLTDTGVNLTIQDDTVRLENNYVGTKLSRAVYPKVNAADVGKIPPVPFGAVSKLPGVCVDAGWITTLANDVLLADTTITVSELPGSSVVGLTVYVESEQMAITAANTSTKVLTVTRAANSTTKIAHSYATLVVEKKSTPFVFLFSSIPVTALGTVYARYQGVDVDITADCAKYTGATGSILSGYSGQAAVTIATTPTLMQAISLAIANGLSVAQGNHNHAANTSTTTITLDSYAIDHTSSFASGVSGNSLAWTSLYDGNQATFYCPNPGYISYRHAAAISNSATPLAIRVALVYSSTYTGFSPGILRLIINGTTLITWNLPTAATPKNTYYSGWVSISAWTDITAATSKLQVELGSAGYFYEAWFEIQTGTASSYNAATGVALTGDLSLVGNSTASVIQLEALLCDVTNGNQATFPDVMNLLLGQGGLPSITTVGAMPSYSCNGAITEYKTYLYWLNYLALQFQCWFAVLGGSPKLISRQSAALAKNIPACRISGDGVRVLSRKKSDLSEVINYINLLYNRDFTQSGDTAYQSALLVQDSTSQGIYGVSEQASLFQFDFVSSDTVAASVAALYLAQFKARHWLATFDVFLDHSELEFGDRVTLGFLGGVQGIVLCASYSPGSSTAMDIITLTVLI